MGDRKRQRKQAAKKIAAVTKQLEKHYLKLEHDEKHNTKYKEHHAAEIEAFNRQLRDLHHRRKRTR